MKKQYFAMTVFCVLWFSGTANATLVDKSNSTGHVVLDNLTGKYWIWDLSLFNNSTYASQITDIAHLNVVGNEYYGINDWHMASAAEMGQLWLYTQGEITGAFSSTHTHPPSEWWTGRYEAIPYAGAHYYTGVVFQHGVWDKIDLNSPFRTYSDANSNATIGAWVVSGAHGPVVPIPAALPLFASFVGLMAFASARRRRKIPF